MKCEENGGCPMLFDGNVCVALDDWAFYGVENPNCHLTPADFPLLNAMITGEWLCEECNVHDSCPAHDRYGDVPCSRWFKPEGGDERG